MKKVHFLKPSKSRPVIIKVKLGRDTVATIQRHSDGTGWFWYSRFGGEPVNTANRHAPLETCKTEVQAHLNSLQALGL